MPATTAVLAYQAAVLILFGLVGLMCFPRAVLRKTGLKAELDDRQLLIYRICGLWVATAGVVSGLAATALAEPPHRSWACLCFAGVHSIEVSLKLSVTPKPSRAVANGHLALLLLIAAALG